MKKIESAMQIAGEAHLAVYHPNINHRSIYPFSLVTSRRAE